MSRAPLALALLLACAPEDRIESGVHIDVVIEHGLEPCGDLVGHMDRFLELVAATWHVDLDRHHYTYRWYTQETFHADSGCGEGILGCARDGTARAHAAPLDHELVHLVTAAVGHPPSFFAEGAAVAFELPVWSPSSSPPGERPILELLTLPSLPSEAYTLAGAYTRHLIDRFGMAAYRRFYGGLERDADLEAIAAAHAAAFSEPLAASIARFDAERRACGHDRFRFKLLECAAPRVAWTDEILTLTRDLACASEHVVGPFEGASARAHASFEVAEAGLFELSAASDQPHLPRLTLGSCGGCESAPPITLTVGMGPQRLRLDAGLHYLQLDASTATDALLSLQLRRVD